MSSNPGEVIVYRFRFDWLVLTRGRRGARRRLRLALRLVSSLLLHALVVLGVGLALVLRLTDEPSPAFSCTAEGHRISSIAAQQRAFSVSRVRGSTPHYSSASR